MPVLRKAFWGKQKGCIEILQTIHWWQTIHGRDRRHHKHRSWQRWPREWRTHGDTNRERGIWQRWSLGAIEGWFHEDDQLEHKLGFASIFSDKKIQCYILSHDIILLMEYWIENNFSIDVDGFHSFIFPKMRSKSNQGGGCVILIREKIRHYMYLFLKICMTLYYDVSLINVYQKVLKICV